MRENQLVVLIAVLAALVAVPAVRADGFVIDHRHVVLFGRIPTANVEAARDLSMLFSDRSVGGNIDGALVCSTAESWPDAPAHCRRDYYDEWNWKTYNEADWLAGQVPERILYDPDPVLYSRANWTFEYRAGSWEELTCDFVNSLAPAYVGSTDVLSYQFSYLNVDEGSTVADESAGFFVDSPDRCDIGDVEALMALHADKTLVFWTASLARGIGTAVSTEFNEQMRDYCRANGRILLDVAAIEAHTHEGVPCYDNRDGVEYVAATGSSENYPDDGYDYCAICQDYTTEVDGGHLGSVSCGKIRIVKAMWVLMARVAGWDPFSGDLDDDGDVDLNDFSTFALCMAGPGVSTPPPSCEAADFVRCDLDEDGDIDLSDFATFAIKFTG